MKRPRIAVFFALPIIVGALIVTVAAASAHKLPSAFSSDIISESEAEQIALNELGVSREEVFVERSELDRKRGITVWEVELHHGSIEYSFDINAKTGEIVSREREREEHKIKGTEQMTNQSPVQPEEPVIPDQKDTLAVTEAPPAERAPAVSELTADQALDIVLADANLTRGQIRELEIEKDREHGTLIYEIDFEHGQNEYEYEVRISDGKILAREIDFDD